MAEDSNGISGIPGNGDNPPLSEAELTLQRKLAEYRAAYEAEFAATQDPEGAKDNIANRAQELYKNNAIRATTDIIWLAFNSTSDSVRLNALKFIQTEAFKHAQADHDPYKKLLEQLSKKPSTESADAASS